VQLVGFYYKNISRWTFLWMSDPNHWFIHYRSQYINLLKTKRRLLYLKTQFVPRS